MIDLQQQRFKRESDAQYWNQQWRLRNKGEGKICHNQGKARLLCSELWKRPHYFGLKKLEIGCGPGTHVFSLARYDDRWRTLWTGIDISEEGIKICKQRRLNAEVSSIYSYDVPDKYELFLFLDSLEHLEFHDRVAQAIKRLAADRFAVFVNVPLYLSKHQGGYEQSININKIVKFFLMCGCKYYTQRVYGIAGYPYMVAEATNDKDFAALSPVE